MGSERPWRAEGCPWPWRARCPRANDLMLTTGTSYLFMRTGPLGCHWLGMWPGAESRVGGGCPASAVVSQNSVPFAKCSAGVGRPVFAQLRPSSDPELSWFPLCEDGSPLATLRCPWNELETVQRRRETTLHSPFAWRGSITRGRKGFPEHGAASPATHLFPAG